MARFEVVSPFSPEGDQPAAIAQLVAGVQDGLAEQVLLGVTGSGKTYTIAKVIEEVNRPTLVLSHNKTLAAQLYQEFRSFFPNNAVEYFVSYYDYYQPEAYVPQSDTFIEKETSINEEIDRLRLRATKALFERRDVLIVASVSCIYGLGSPESFYGMLHFFQRGDESGMESALRQLVDMRYERTAFDLFHGSFRARGDVLEILPAYEDVGVRIEYFGDEIERVARFDVLRGDVLEEVEKVAIFPKTHYVTPEERLRGAIETISVELCERLAELEAHEKLLERQRLEQRTMFDLEMLREMGYCHGIENYSRHLTGRVLGEPPPTLLNYLPDDFLMVIDESHQTVPQVRGMYAGDRSRKQTLVEYGFRLPSALDNRPLTFDEFDALVGQRIYISATPGDWELERTHGVIAEQVVRPTGLLDPVIEVRPAKGQVDDLVGEIREVTKRGEILDADKEGFLRSETSLIQTSGRAARNLNGRVIFFADRVTDSMKRAIDETERRRERQRQYNEANGVEPKTILKDIHSPIVQMSEMDYHAAARRGRIETVAESDLSLNEQITRFEKAMKRAAKDLDFEEAAQLRDRIKELRELQIYSA